MIIPGSFVALLLLKLRDGALRIRERSRIVRQNCPVRIVLLPGGPSDGKKMPRHKNRLTDVRKITARRSDRTDRVYRSWSKHRIGLRKEHRPQRRTQEMMRPLAEPFAVAKTHRRPRQNHRSWELPVVALLGLHVIPRTTRAMMQTRDARAVRVQKSRHLLNSLRMLSSIWPCWRDIRSGEDAHLPEAYSRAAIDL